MSMWHTGGLSVGQAPTGAEAGVGRSQGVSTCYSLGQFSECLPASSLEPLPWQLVASGAGKARPRCGAPR